MNELYIYIYVYIIINIDRFTNDMVFVSSKWLIPTYCFLMVENHTHQALLRRGNTLHAGDTLRCQPDEI
jgi:hypothetical protein